MTRFVALLLCVAIYAPIGLAEKRPMSPIDMVEMPRLGNGELSFDGRYLLYEISTTNWAENEKVDRYQLLDVFTGEQLPAPNPEDETVDVRAAVWAPDRHAFLFLRRPSKDEPVQVFQYDVETQEREQLTDLDHSVSSIFWGADPSTFYFIARAQKSKLVEDQIDSKWLIEPYDTPRHREIWAYDLNTQTSEKLVAGDFSIRDAYAHGEQAIVFVKVPNHMLNVSHLGEVVVYDLKTDQYSVWTQNDYRESDPKLSPDGSMIAYIATVNEAGDPYYEDKVFVQRRGQAPKRVMGEQAFEALDFAWDRAGTGLYILGNTGLRSDIYHYTLETGEVQQVSNGDHRVTDWIYDPDIDTHLARFETSDSPGDFFVSGQTGAFERLTDVYVEWAETFELPVQEPVQWSARDGREIEGLLVFPIGYRDDQSYPLVTITHGGPRSSSQFGSWNMSRYVPVLAGQGYMVFLPNHRGGTGYGDAFMRDMYGGYFRNAHLDVMDGIDALIDRGLANPDRLIKTGWSAGGHMVNKLITYTDRFKAASSGAGAADWRSMHGESDVRHSRAFMFGGSPWDKDAPLVQYEADSPINEAWKVVTPTLFFSGEDDVRVPPTQSILMHRAVIAAGAPSSFYLMPGEPHGFGKPANQLFKINTDLAWFARFALDQTYDPVLPREAFEFDQEKDADRSETEGAQAQTTEQ